MLNEKDNKERAILEAAEQEFMTRGYDGARTVAIAAAAGVTHAMLHYYYRTKRNLYEQVVRGKVELLAQSVIDAFAGHGNEPLVERIVHGAMTHYDFLRANPLMPSFIIVQMADDEHREMFARFVKQYGSAVIAHLQGEIDEQVAAGTMQAINAVDLLLDVVSLNIFPFLIRPIVEHVGTQFYGIDDVDTFYTRRKHEVERVLRARLEGKGGF